MGDRSPVPICLGFPHQFLAVLNSTVWALGWMHGVQQDGEDWAVTLLLSPWEPLALLGL